MFITKKLFAIILLFAIQITSPIYWAGYKTYCTYVELAEKKLMYAMDKIQWNDHGNLDIVWWGKTCVDELYIYQKAALKELLKQLKENEDATIVNHFKSGVYDQWKREFNKHYEQALIDDDWSWFYNPSSFTFMIEE